MLKASPATKFMTYVDTTRNGVATAAAIQQPTVNAVELRAIRKAYDQFVAVDHLSLNIREGSVYGLLGPNGAGKTSTIRMMIGITLPDDGEVRVFGERFHRALLNR